MRLRSFLYMTSLLHTLYSEALYRTTTTSPNPSTAGTAAGSAHPQLTSPSSLYSNAVTQKRLTCSEGSFNFSVEFERPFSGIIYTEGAQSPRCVYVEGWKNPRTQLQFLIPTDACGSITTRNGTLFQTTNTFLVQRDPKLIELNDNAYTVVCQRYYPTNKDQDGNSIGTVTMIYERFEVIGPTEEVITRSVNEVLGKEVQFGTRLALGEDPDGPLPERPVQLGEKLTYVFYCATNSSIDKNVAKDCTIGECMATDPTGTRRVQLSDQNGCSRHPTVWSDFFSHDLQLRSGIRAKKVLLAHLSAWSFPTSSHVLISCRARSCDGTCPGGPSACVRASSSSPIGSHSGFELAPSGSELLNDTAALGDNRLANDAVDGAFSNDNAHSVLDDAVVAYKVDRSAGAAGLFANGRLCPTSSELRPGAGGRTEPLSQPEMITAEAPRLLLPIPVLPPPVAADSGQLRSRTGVIVNNVSNNNNNRKCVAMDVFVGLISSLLTALGVLTFVVGWLMFKLHNYNNRASVVRIEKRGCPF